MEKLKEQGMMMRTAPPTVCIALPMETIGMMSETIGIGVGSLNYQLSPFSIGR